MRGESETRCLRKLAWPPMILGSIILAGGRSRRMGRPKESLPFAGSTLLGHTVDVLLDCTFPVVVVARDQEQELPPINLEADLVFDDRLDEGPLMGMLAGLRFLDGRCDAAFVTGCDNPTLSSTDIDWLAAKLGDHDAVMARIEGILQPLSAVYRLSILQTVESKIAAGIRTARSLAEGPGARVLSQEEVDHFDPSRRFLSNLNQIEDYRAAIDADERGR